MPYTKTDWKADRKKLSQERADLLNRNRVQGRKIKALTVKNTKRTREINNQYERALNQVNQRYAKSRGMKF